MRSVLCPLLLLSIAACTASKANVAASAEPTTHALSFIEDDYAKAVTEAKSRSLPIFVDVWAPW